MLYLTQRSHGATDSTRGFGPQDPGSNPGEITKFRPEILKEKNKSEHIVSEHAAMLKNVDEELNFKALLEKYGPKDYT